MTPFIFDVSPEAFVEDPYPTYRRLRQDAPAYYHEESSYWFITRYSDVERAATDYATFSSAYGNVVVDSPLRVGKTLGSMDPPRHDELRRVIQRALGPARIEVASNVVRKLTEEKISGLAGKKVADVVADIGRPILFNALGALLGFDEDASRRATELTAGLFHQDGGLVGPAIDQEETAAMFDFLSEQLRGRQAGKGNDLMSVLLEMQSSGAPMSDDEIVANISTVLAAGNASIGHFFPNLIHALWLHPDQRRQVLDNPSLIPAVIEESVRWDTSTQSFARQVMRDTDIGGVTIPANSRAVVFYGSANHDESVITAASQFNINRQRVRHFGFGLGPHVCAGSVIARSLIKLMLEQLLPALGDYELDVRNATRVKHIMVRGFVTLPISWK